MTTTLLTFLGRLPGKERAYRKTSYDFGNGDFSEPVAFFGWALQQRVKADRVVIMGTAGSMWDHLFESADFAFGAEAEEARLRLLDATEEKAVAAEILAPLQDPLSKRVGRETRLVIIPYCRTERQQIELLGIMARHVESGATVHIDVSHGFRHLPMIALVAALHLQVTRKADIGGIWYGGYDPETGEAPVHNLVGLLRIVDWIKALYTYDKDGDYSVFQPLLGPASDFLVRAAFFERTSNVVKAREALSTWSSLPDRFMGNDPATVLFREELEQRVCWFRMPDRASWEKELARRYLKQRDYVRAAIYGLEALITARIIESSGNPSDCARRDAVRKELKTLIGETFQELNHLRNCLAHGFVPPNNKIARALEDETQLREALEKLFRELLGP